MFPCNHGFTCHGFFATKRFVLGQPSRAPSSKSSSLLNFWLRLKTAGPGAVVKVSEMFLPLLLLGACSWSVVDAVRLPSICDDTTCLHGEQQKLGKNLGSFEHAPLQVVSRFFCALLTIVFPFFLYRWYRPEDHVEHLQEFMGQLSESASKWCHVLDVFGASQKVSETWERSGYHGQSYDIKLSKSHDITTEKGFKCLLQLAFGSFHFEQYEQFWTEFLIREES